MAGAFWAQMDATWRELPRKDADLCLIAGELAPWLSAVVRRARLGSTCPTSNRAPEVEALARDWAHRDPVDNPVEEEG